MRIIIVKEIKNEKYHHQRYCQMKMKKQKSDLGITRCEHPTSAFMVVNIFHSQKSFPEVLWVLCDDKMKKERNSVCFVLYSDQDCHRLSNIRGAREVKKSLDCLDGKLTTPRRENTTHFHPSWLLKVSHPCIFDGLFELTWCPSSALNLTLHVASGTMDIQGHHEGCHARRRGPRAYLVRNW